MTELTGNPHIETGNPHIENSSGGNSLGIDYTIAAVDRAMLLLEVLGRIGPASLADLAKEAECTRSIIFRLLHTLHARGFAIQDGPRGQWRLGARLTTLQNSTGAQGALAATAGPRLIRLAAETGEIIYLLGRVAAEAEVIAVHHTDPKAYCLGTPGARWPLHAGCGRLLLATAPEVVRVQLLAQKLPRFTPLTISDPQKVAADLGRIQTRGWLITESEVHAGVVSISVPVRDMAGQVVASVTIAGPTIRLRGNRPRELLLPVHAAAMDISRMLGWHDRRAPSTTPGLRPSNH